MESTSFEWMLTLLGVHLAFLIGVVHMYRGAPCWLQKLAIALLVIGGHFFVFAYIAAVLGVERWWHILILAFVFEHLAVLVWVFRFHLRPHGNADRSAPQVR